MSFLLNSYRFASAELSAPENTVAPTISGDTPVGSTLTRDQGTWTGNPTPTLTDQWTRDNVDIPGATNATYETTDDDFGKTIRVKVTGTNSEGSDTATSSNSITVTDGDVLLDATFASDDEGFSAGTRSAGEGRDWEAGYLELAANTTASKSFTAQSSGVIRFDFHVRVNDTETASFSSAKDTFIYMLPTAGDVTSANALAVLHIERNTDGPADEHMWNLSYRNSAGFQDLFRVARGAAFVRLSVVLDFDADTYSIYVDDLLMLRGISVPNSSASDVSRVVVLNNTDAPTTAVDSIRVTKDWAEPAEASLVSDDFTVGTNEIEDSQPETDNVNLHKQNWHVPIVSGAGSFTRSADGLVADAGDQCSALYRVGTGEGTAEVTFTAATSEDVYGGVITNSWGGATIESAIIARYWSGASVGEKLRLFADDKAIASADLSGTSISAGADWTLRIRKRGRYLWVYVNDVEQFGGPVLHGAADQRGLLQEHHAGVYIDRNNAGVGATNYVKDFTYTGYLIQARREMSVGDWTALAEAGRVVEIYNDQLAAATTNMFWSGGIQFGHMAEHDMSPYAPEVRPIYITDNLAVFQARNICLSEGGARSLGDCHVLLRRASLGHAIFWASDRLFIGDKVNFAPDFDLRESVISRTFRYIQATGASTEVEKTLSGSFVNLVDNAALPMGWQIITDPASGDKVRFTHLTRANENSGGAIFDLEEKLAGEGDPHSFATSVDSGQLSNGTTYEVGRLVLMERGDLSLDDTTFQALRDDIKTPLTPTVSVGTLKTDADGDLDTDGFNERFGWAEIDCDGSGHATFTIDGATTARYYPAVRLNGFTSGGSITGLTEGVDYLLDDLGDGNALVQILSVVSASTEYEYTT